LGLLKNKAQALKRLVLVVSRGWLLEVIVDGVF
jgi:hypothetical protein